MKNYIKVGLVLIGTGVLMLIAYKQNNKDEEVIIKVKSTGATMIHLSSASNYDTYAV